MTSVHTHAGPASDHAQYALLTASAAFGQTAAGGGGVGTGHSPRSSPAGPSWHRTPAATGRPASNPSPSRGGGSTGATAPGQLGRTAQPSRGAAAAGTAARSSAQHKFGYAFDQQQGQQLADFFTATSLKASAQRYGECCCCNRSGQVSMIKHMFRVVQQTQRKNASSMAAQGSRLKHKMDVPFKTCQLLTTIHTPAQMTSAEFLCRDNCVHLA